MQSKNYTSILWYIWCGSLCDWFLSLNLFGMGDMYTSTMKQDSMEWSGRLFDPQKYVITHYMGLPYRAVALVLGHFGALACKVCTWTMHSRCTLHFFGCNAGSLVFYSFESAKPFWHERGVQVLPFHKSRFLMNLWNRHLFEPWKHIVIHFLRLPHGMVTLVWVHVDVLTCKICLWTNHAFRKLYVMMWSLGLFGMGELYEYYN